MTVAVTPSLKSYGISGRGRLFEVKQRVKEANAGRQHDAPGRRLDGTSHFFSELQANPSLAIDFIIAPPRMAYYMEYSTRIYQVYLKYIAPEDIVVYSIDEVFMDVTDYLNTYKLSAHDLAMKIILDVLETTGITATAGIGTNLFLCKVAMDIVAKHIPADKNGVRIAELDETKFRRELWSHQPLTDFWRVGRGIAKKLEQNGMFTMGDVALCSERNEDLLILFDDVHTATAWRILESYTKLPVEHIMIERIKQNKSLVDIKLTARACQEHYQKQVDSFVIVSSDSDYWGLISSLPDARFLVMIEREKCGPDMKAALAESGIFYCYLDDFYSGNSEDIKKNALFKEMYRWIDNSVHLNVNDMFDAALRNTRIDMSPAERRQFYEKHIKHMTLQIDEDGNVGIELKRG